MLVTGMVVGVLTTLVLFHFLVMDFNIFYAKLERFLHKGLPI